MLPGDDCRALHCHTALLMSSRRQCCWCDLICGAHLTISRCWPRSAASCSVVASFSSSTSMFLMEKRPADFRFPVPETHLPACQMQRKQENTFSLVFRQEGTSGVW